MLTRTLLALSRGIRVTPDHLARLVDHVPPWVIRRVARARLLRTLEHVYFNSPAQRERWNRTGIKISDLRSPEVLPHIPLTTGTDLIEHPEDFLCVPREKLIHVVNTTGTKGRPKRVYLTAQDLEQHLSIIGSHFLRLPGPARALVMLSMRLPGWASPEVTKRAFRKAGLFVVLSGTEHSPHEQMAAIREHNINLLLTAPTYLRRLTLEADCDPKTLGVRYVFLGTQPWPEELRTEMEKTWGATLIDSYGSAETLFGFAAECDRQNGLHVPETEFWLEVVDPVSGEVLPDGEEGELIITTLSRVGMPLVRYRTGDIAHLLPREGRCACGLPFRKMSRVRGRWDDLLIVGVGTNVYPDSIDAAVMSVPGVTDYQIVVEKDSYRDALRVTVEHDGEGTGLRDAVVKALLTIREIRDGCEDSRTIVIDRFEVVPPGTLSAGRPKSNRIVDRRG